MLCLSLRLQTMRKLFQDSRRDSVLCIITIAHSFAVPAEFLGFDMDDGVEPRSPIELGIRDEGVVEDVEVEIEYEAAEGLRDAPRAEDGDEVPPSERVLQAPTDGSVLVEAVRIGLDCSLKEFELHVNPLTQHSRIET